MDAVLKQKIEEERAAQQARNWVSSPDVPRPMGAAQDMCGQTSAYVGASPVAVESEWRSILFAKLDQKRSEMREIEEALSALSDPAIVKIQRIINIVNRP